MESFQKEFDMLRELGNEVFNLKGSNMLVEVLVEEDLQKTKGGIYIGVDKNQMQGNLQQHKLQVGRVLMVGEGYYDPEAENAVNGYVPLETKPGAIVLLPQYSAQSISMFPGVARPTTNLVLLKEDQIVGLYPTQEAFELAKSKINQ